MLYMNVVVYKRPFEGQQKPSSVGSLIKMFLAGLNYDEKFEEQYAQKLVLKEY